MRSWKKMYVSLVTAAVVIAAGSRPIPAGSSPSATISLLGVGGDAVNVAFAVAPAAPVTAPILQPPQAPEKRESDGGLYTVKPGDTLSELAERFLGSASLWPRIYRMNSELIQDPDLILVGWKLRIPGRGDDEPSSPDRSGADRARQDPPPTGASSAELESWKGGKLPPEKFIRLIGPVAQEVYRKTGVPASVTLAQAALETGWGDATIGDAKNLFGIKGSGPAGSIKVPTQEFENGRYVTINDSFRKYRSWFESVEDHAQFFHENSRYATALKHGGDADQFAREIAKAGYATDPSYASKLINLMKEFDLYRWDRR